jgi:chromate transporter
MKLKKEKHVYWKVFSSFFKIGAFTFGGGYAMIPLIYKEAVEEHEWITDEDMLDILAIAESTPGVIAVNSATFVGYRAGGVWGSFLATCGVALPSFLVISVLSFFIGAIKNNQWVLYAFMGIRAGVVALLANTVIKLLKGGCKTAFGIGVMAFAFLLATATTLDVVYIILVAAVAGVLYTSLRAAKDEGDSPK